ncbi:hypothetical protein L3X38_025631 [Prunus dulcis]|uniref:Uncharacterized protein n=1 Tax=Prunus dulcis TaxID=3755 RepID=A0AAD4Z867_PRUDU|nr:hypothetical protein L3X38_025631 [Prunus dulcis]
MEMRIVARENLGYLTGAILKPPELSLTYNKWCTENFRVNGWLINSMSPDFMGLDLEVDQVRGEVLRKDLKLDIDQTFAYVHIDAPQRMSMIGAQEPSVMVAQSQKRSQTSTGDSSHNKALTSRPKKKCTHCGRDKHTHVGCYELIGYLDWWDYSKALRRNMSKSLNTSSKTDLDIFSSKTIGCGTKRGKLYYFDLGPDNEAKVCQTFKMGGASVEKQKDKVWLRHRHWTCFVWLFTKEVLEENLEPSTQKFLDFFKAEESQPKSDQSPPPDFEHPKTLPQNNRLLVPNDQSPPRCQNQEEEIYSFAEILPHMTHLQL